MKENPARRERNRLIREQWSRNIKVAMSRLDIKNANQLHVLIKQQYGDIVSRAAVLQWVNGEAAPEPYMQGVLGAVLGEPARYLFPVENVPPTRVAA